MAHHTSYQRFWGSYQVIYKRVSQCYLINFDIPRYQSIYGYYMYFVLKERKDSLPFHVYIIRISVWLLLFYYAANYFELSITQQFSMEQKLLVNDLGAIFQSQSSIERVGSLGNLIGLGSCVILLTVYSAQNCTDLAACVFLRKITGIHTTYNRMQKQLHINCWTSRAADRIIAKTLYPVGKIKLLVECLFFSILFFHSKLKFHEGIFR